MCVCVCVRVNECVLCCMRECGRDSQKRDCVILDDLYFFVKAKLLRNYFFNPRHVHNFTVDAEV